MFADANVRVTLLLQVRYECVEAQSYGISIGKDSTSAHLDYIRAPR
jgi:hypothetical protein